MKSQELQNKLIEAENEIIRLGEKYAKYKTMYKVISSTSMKLIELPEELKISHMCSHEEVLSYAGFNECLIWIKEYNKGKFVLINNSTALL